jgi:hypothetical protein
MKKFVNTRLSIEECDIIAKALSAYINLGVHDASIVEKTNILSVKFNSLSKEKAPTLQLVLDKDKNILPFIR